MLPASETSVNFYQTTQRNVPGGSHIQEEEWLYNNPSDPARFVPCNPFRFFQNGDGTPQAAMPSQP
jgi:hypothetical protein